MTTESGQHLGQEGDDEGVQQKVGATSDTYEVGDPGDDRGHGDGDKGEDDEGQGHDPAARLGAGTTWGPQHHPTDDPDRGDQEDLDDNP